MKLSAVDTYAPTLDFLEEVVHSLTKRVPSAELKAAKGEILGPRYTEMSLQQAIVQKMARAVSSLRAACLLHSQGFFQEQAAIQRMVDEASEDALFLAFGAINGIATLHEEFLRSFYLEEFADPSRPLETKIPRPQIRRSKIHAFIVRAQGGTLDTSTADAAMQSIHKTYSGYVHGASPHIMEMYNLVFGRFDMNGSHDARLCFDHADDLWNYVYRAILSAAMSALAFDDREFFNEIHQYARWFDTTQPR